MGSVARSIVDAVAVHGATTVFGLPGVHNLAFWKVPEGAPLVVRHEQAAVYAADGWARATGRLGAAVVTTGPGAANALAAFGEAAAARSPVLLVASEIPQALRRAGRLRGVLHESRDQAGLFRPLAKAVFTPRSAAEVAGVLDAAVAAAMRHPRGPVYMDVPADVLGHEAVAPARGGRPGSSRCPPRRDLDAAAAVLAGRPRGHLGGRRRGGRRAVGARCWPSTWARRWWRASAAAACRPPRTRSRSACPRTSPRWRS